MARAHSLQEVGGGTATMGSELRRIGYLGSVPASYRSTPMSAHFELHIEQGPILEAEKQKIGVVQGVQAYKWFSIEVEGRGWLLLVTIAQVLSDDTMIADRLYTQLRIQVQHLSPPAPMPCSLLQS